MLCYIKIERVLRACLGFFLPENPRQALRLRHIESACGEQSANDQRIFLPG